MGVVSAEVLVEHPPVKSRLAPIPVLRSTVHRSPRNGLLMNSLGFVATAHLTTQGIHSSARTAKYE